MCKQIVNNSNKILKEIMFFLLNIQNKSLLLNKIEFYIQNLTKNYLI